MKVHHMGLQEYESVWIRMKDFTVQRQDDAEDELWLLEHFPVYTQGQAGKPEHILNPSSIPVVQSDRGGQVTYHGPGQLVAYILMDIGRRHLGIRSLVCQLEQVLINTLSEFGITGTVQCGAPGVYVGGKKIASIGLRVKNGRTYHGIALNVNMDLNPFLGINPCGYSQMEMTQISDYDPNVSLKEASQTFEKKFLNHFNTETL